jgi:hypothetical protein
VAFFILWLIFYAVVLTFLVCSAYAGVVGITHHIGWISEKSHKFEISDDSTTQNSVILFHIYHVIILGLNIRLSSCVSNIVMLNFSDAH